MSTCWGILFSFIFKAITTYGTFLGQVSADVSALKTVGSALGPEAKLVLEQQMVVERDKIQQGFQEILAELESLRLRIFRLTNY